MKRYKTRPGVVLTTISDQYFLVAAKTVRDLCPYSSQINETAAFCWRILEDGADFDTLFACLSEEYEIDDSAAVKADLQELLDQLLKANYLIEEP